MKTFLTSSLVIAAMLNAYSQTIDNFSIDSGGAITSNGGVTLVYSIGEVTIGEPTAGNVSLSSGFLNGSLNTTVTASEVYPSSEFRISIYPNPASERVHIKTPLMIEYLELYNSLGYKVIHQKNYSSSLDVSTLKPGLYTLRIISTDRELSKNILIN